MNALAASFGILMLCGCSQPDAAPVARSAAPLPSVAMSSSATAASSSSGASPRTKPAVTPSTTSSATTSATAKKPVKSTFLIECADSNLVSEPTSFSLACGDGNASLTNMKWVSWGSAQALATGVFVENSCDPNCAQGTPKSYDVKVLATTLGVHGASQVYEKLTVTFTGAVPQDAERVTAYPMLH